jgi:hypothetical protein
MNCFCTILFERNGIAKMTFYQIQVSGRYVGSTVEDGTPNVCRMAGREAFISDLSI